MASVSYTASNTASGNSFWASLKSAIVVGLDIYMTRHSRTREIERLNALSDEKLAELGVKRDDIVYHVFRDQFYI
ncbi:hypothetical protein [Albirhodobacter sp. R86504]|jgi:uncharacterized protein YjiS (DUF1127 family)|uniref:hypothetical protein n=1 Tax=Albirhodobacter sp. R86504 TaxID=3093848 RepID=UPI003672C759